jgi:hypothetical protein
VKVGIFPKTKKNLKHFWVVAPPLLERPVTFRQHPISAAHILPAYIQLLIVGPVFKLSWIGWITPLEILVMPTDFLDDLTTYRM